MFHFLQWITYKIQSRHLYMNEEHKVIDVEDEFEGFNIKKIIINAKISRVKVLINKKGHLV